MDIIHHILQDIPFFRQFTDYEITNLSSIGKIEVIPNGQRLALRKLKSCCIVIEGLFEIETVGKRDVFYLHPATFFGEVPFVKRKRHGFVRAVTDSRIMLFDSEDLYRFFMESYKGLRGYLRSTHRMGFDINETGRALLEGNSKVVTAYSPHRDSGKSLFSSFCGIALSQYGRTIIMDLSYHGNSIFGFFEKEIAPAISQKLFQEASPDQFIDDRILDIDENLSLLNIAFGSKVKVNSDILSPILLILSKRYKYIVMDLSDSDKDLRDRAFCLSDIIFALIKKIRDRDSLYDLFDNTLKEGQRVFYTINKYYAKDVGAFEGGYIFENLVSDKDEFLPSSLKRYVNDDNYNEIIKIVIKKRSGLVVETNLVESVFFTGLFNALHKADTTIDLIYSSSWSFLIISLFLLSRDISEFEKSVLKLFSEERINSFLDVTFPDEYIFKNSRIHRFAYGIAGDCRLEMYSSQPMVMLTNEESRNRRIFSTGFIRDLLSASFLLYPIFESLRVADNYYNSGFPMNRVGPQDLFRTDVDELTHASVQNKHRLRFGGNVMEFYRRYIDYMYQSRPYNHFNNLADKNICIKLEEKDYNLKEIIRISEEVSGRLLQGGS